MLGAMIGDIVGSGFEFDNYRGFDFFLFDDRCFVTDDSIMSLAVAKAIMEASKIKPILDNNYSDNDYQKLSELTIQYMQEIGKKYPNCGYGGMFYQWVFSQYPQPYNSFGNGAAMRISPVGFIAQSEQQLKRLSKAVTAVTHNHKEGIKGAEATAMAIYLARNGATKNEIRTRIVQDYYPINFRIDDIRRTYQFNETCQETVPQAIQCFLESTSFEDAIRTAISLGGDSDTIAAITGAIAQAYYGVPPWMKKYALDYVNNSLTDIYNEWVNFAPKDKGHFGVLTKYINKFKAADNFGEWVVSEPDKDGLTQFPYFSWSELVSEFFHEFHDFLQTHTEYNITNYKAALKRKGIEWGAAPMQSADPKDYDNETMLVLILGIIRADRFAEGTLNEFLENGSITRWLERLKYSDDNGFNNN